MGAVTYVTYVTSDTGVTTQVQVLGVDVVVDVVTPEWTTSMETS